jgi:hypothetical protein
VVGRLGWRSPNLVSAIWAVSIARHSRSPDLWAGQWGTWPQGAMVLWFLPRPLGSALADSAGVSPLTVRLINPWNYVALPQLLPLKRQPRQLKLPGLSEDSRWTNQTEHFDRISATQTHYPERFPQKGSDYLEMPRYLSLEMGPY